MARFESGQKVAIPENTRFKVGQSIPVQEAPPEPAEERILRKSVFSNLKDAVMERKAEWDLLVYPAQKSLEDFIARIDGLDNDDRTTFTGMLRQASIGYVNTALIDAPAMMVGEEEFGKLRSGARAERFARGLGTTLGFIGPGLTSQIFKKGAQMGTKYAMKAIRKGLVKKATYGSLNRKLAARAGFQGAGAFGSYSAAQNVAGAAVGKDKKSAPERIFEVGGGVIIGGLFGIAAHNFIPIAAKHAGRFWEGVKQTSSEIQQAATGQLIKEAEKKALSLGRKTENLLQQKNFKAAYQHIDQNYTGTTRIKFIRRWKAVKRSNKIQQRAADRAKGIPTRSIPSSQKDISDRITEDITGIVTGPAIRDTIGAVKETAFSTMDRWPVIHSIAKKGGKIIMGAGEYISRSSGPAGRDLIKRIYNTRDEYQVRSGESLKEWVLVKNRRLSKLERTTFADVVEGRKEPVSASQHNAIVWWNTIKNELFAEAKKYGIDVSYREKYFPHALINNYSSRTAIQQTADAAFKRGEFTTKHEAKRAIKDYISWLRTRKANKGLIDTVRKFNPSMREMKDDTIVTALNKLAEQIDNYKFGNLEAPRSLNLPFWDPDPNRAISKYVIGTNKRIAEAKWLGMTGKERSTPIVETLLKRISDDGGDYEAAKLLFEREMGFETGQVLLGARIMGPLTKQTPEVYSKRVSQGLRSFQIITKLGFGTAVSNASQSVNTAIRTDIKSTMKAIQNHFSKRVVNFSGIKMTGKELAYESGAIVEGITNAIMSEAMGGGTGLSSLYLKSIGFSGVETLNRSVAANAGAHYAQTLARKYNERVTRFNDQIPKSLISYARGKVAKRGMKQTARELKRLGISPEKVVKNNGILDFTDYREAARRVVSDTQFITNPVDIPLPFSSPHGQIIFQYKNFAFKQAKFFKDAIIKELMAGNVRPFLRAAALMPVVGEGVADIRAILDGRFSDRKKRNLLNKSRMIENMAAVGGAGILYDAYVAVQYGRVGGFAAGPTGSDILSTFDILTHRNVKNFPMPGSLRIKQRTADQKTEAQAKFLGRQIPYTGAATRTGIRMNKNDRGSGVVGKIYQASPFGQSPVGINWVLKAPFIMTSLFLEEILNRRQNGRSGTNSRRQ